MDIDRSAYSGGVPMHNIEECQKDAAKYDRKFYDGYEYVGYHEIHEGINTFRIAFPHDPADSPYVPIRIANLEILIDEYNADGEKTGAQVWKRRKVYISTQHGPKDQNNRPLIKEDIIETYIEHLMTFLKEIESNSKEREKLLAPIHGSWVEGKWRWGIRPETKTVCFAWNDKGELKLLELNKRWYSEVEALIVGSSKPGEPVIDCFSHIDNGFPLIIEKVVNKEPGKRNKIEYKIRKEFPDANKREGWDTFFERTRITDEQISELLEKKSLKQMFTNNYTRSDFKKIAAGLQRFDKENKFNLFNDNNFRNKCTEIKDNIWAYIEDEEENKEQNS